MGNKLFGVDIAKIVNDSVTSAGGALDGVLYREPAGERVSGSLAGGLMLQYTNFDLDFIADEHLLYGDGPYAFSGFMETEEVRRPGTTVSQSRSVVTVLGDSIDVEPLVNDTVVMEGAEWKLLELLERDPAAAVYRFRAEYN